ncbi:MAG: hypothetical protein A2X12_11435 [Bacteroidetes bacterium GWE2_29_8]|nr:MAG: hypothetical protein A2X12_11435 [Bacteroidetes bacterium GWE2_29_8]
MFIYKFRITQEDHDDFVRDIEIMSNQTFEDFHKFFVSQFNLDSTQLASFYISNSRWNKKQEITLIDMSDDDENKMPIMSETKISDFIDDPHQRLIYINDFINLITFYIDLLKITKGDKENKKDFPKIVKSEGRLPIYYDNKKSKIVHIANNNLEEDKEILSEELIYDEDEIGDFSGEDDFDMDMGDDISINEEENDFNY